MINEIFEWIVGGASNRTASKFFRLVEHKIEISYGKLGTNKILTSSSERVLESNFVLIFREGHRYKTESIGNFEGQSNTMQ